MPKINYIIFKGKEESCLNAYVGSLHAIFKYQSGIINIKLLITSAVVSRDNGGIGDVYDNFIHSRARIES